MTLQFDEAGRHKGGQSQKDTATMKLFGVEVRWAETVGRTFFPPGVLGGVTDGVSLGARFAHDLACAPWEAALMTRLALWLAWFAPVWRWRRVCSLGRLALSERVTLLETLLVADSYLVRSAMTFLKLRLATVVLGEPALFARIGAYVPTYSPTSDREPRP